MNYEKLKRLASLIIVLIFIIFIASNCERKVSSDEEQQNLKEHQDVSTETPFDISEVEEDGIARDYTNPTEEEEEEAYIIYGKDGCYFDEKGLHIKLENGKEILRTQLVLEDFEFLKTIPMPDEKKIEYFEYEVNMLRIFLKNISEKENESYLKKIKEIYKYPVTITEATAIYKADSAEGHRVTVFYNIPTQKAMYNFKIFEPYSDTM